MAHSNRQSKHPNPSMASGCYEVEISSRGLPRTLLIGALVLLALHTALYVYHYRVGELPWLVLQLFDVDQENNLPSWYSGFLLGLTSCLLWVCARQKRVDGDRWCRHWYVLSIGFLLLSVDEVAGVHESINSVIVMTWAIAGGVLAGVIGLAFVPFVLHLPRRTALLFAAAGAAYLAGTVGIEIIGNNMVSHNLQDTLPYIFATLVEESLEMLGVVLFVHSLLAYMREPGEDAVRTSVKVT